MNFREFQEYRTKLLAVSTQITDFAETNLWRTLSDLVPILPEGDGAHVHRCHLAQAWLSVFGMPSEWSSRAFISCGVRHSLSLLFAVAKERGLRVLIPKDVYPVYGELAKTADVSLEVFPTLPELHIPTEGDWLLLPNPMKPAGRWLTDHEVVGLKRWLAQEPSRRLLLDVVYTFETRFHPTTQSLIDTRQTILLHSLSKGWLHPQVFGVALVPECDAAGLASVFRENSPTQQNLRRASFLLQDTNTPSRVSAHLNELRSNTLAQLPEEIKALIMHPDGAIPVGYMIPVAMPWETVLKKYGLLTIPLSVFGSTEMDGCVVSTLGAAASRRG
jgi:aspartate/methionine/tyrosine aminotransferase